jgi:hypothetical protein
VAETRRHLLGRLDVLRLEALGDVDVGDERVELVDGVLVLSLASRTRILSRAKVTLAR